MDVEGVFVEERHEQLAPLHVVADVGGRGELGDERFERHAAVLRAMPSWTLRLVAPPDLPSVGDGARRVVEQHLMSPLRPITVGEMRWHFEQLRSAAPTDMLRFERARRAFSNPHSQAVYKLWKQDGEAALVSVGSDAIRQAVAAGRGRVEVLDLGHRYGHLSPLAAVS